MSVAGGKLGIGVAVAGIEVAVGGTEVAVAGTGVAVGGPEVAVAGMGVAVGGTDVAVGVSEAAVVIISWGRFVASRLARLIAVLLLSVSAKLNDPFPATSEVTSTDVHVPPLTAPDELIALPMAGALPYVMAVSPHVLFATPCTL